MEIVTTPEFRVSFPAVFTPQAFEGQEAKYSIVMLFDKSTDLSALKKLALKAIEAKWPDATKRPKGLRNPFRDGDTEKPDVAGYANCIFVRASTKMKPGVVDQTGKRVIQEEEGIFYAGCYARAQVSAFAYDQKGNRGVSFSLQHVQLIRDGEPFSGRSRPEDAFEALETPLADFGGKAEAVEEDPFA